MSALSMLRFARFGRLISLVVPWSVRDVKENIFYHGATATGLFATHIIKHVCRSLVLVSYIPVLSLNPTYFGVRKCYWFQYIE